MRILPGRDYMGGEYEDFTWKRLYGRRICGFYLEETIWEENMRILPGRDYMGGEYEDFTWKRLYGRRI